MTLRWPTRIGHWTIAAGARRRLDLAGYKDRVRKSRAPFPDQRFYMQNLLAEGDVAIMSWLWSATHMGDLPGFSATGNRIRMSGATAYYSDNGRLTGHWQVTD
jgi:predicted ester cyclase